MTPHTNFIFQERTNLKLTKKNLKTDKMEQGQGNTNRGKKDPVYNPPG